VNFEQDTFHILLRKGTMFSEISQGPIRLRRCVECAKARILACACLLLFFLTVAGSGWAQSSIDESRASSEAQSDVPSEDFPSSRDEADATPETDELPSGSSQEPSRSFLEIGLHASGGVDTNPSGILGSSSQLSSLTHLLGSFDLQKIRPRSQTVVDYLGGGTFWDGTATTGHYNQQQLDARERIRWSRGQLSLRDSFQYLGEGNSVSPTVAGSGANDLLTADSGDQPFEVIHQAYITHVSTADLGEALTRRSLAHVGVSYSLTNYLGNGESSFDSRQASIMAGLNYQLGRKNSVGIAYRFQNLEFPNSSAGHLFANSAIFLFHRTLSTRMDFIAGAGPELVTTGGGTGPATSQINANAQASLLYTWRRSGVSLAYNRLVTSGADVYAGANSNIASASAYRNISRSWRSTVEGGYTQATGINLISATIPGSSYRYAFLGTTIRRRFGSSLSGFASYQFNNENFGDCPSTCNVQTRRHVVLIGLDWYLPRIPLD
jgi:hypothetical protein